MQSAHWAVNSTVMSSICRDMANQMYVCGSGSIYDGSNRPSDRIFAFTELSMCDCSSHKCRQRHLSVIKQAGLHPKFEIVNAYNEISKQMFYGWFNDRVTVKIFYIILHKLYRVISVWNRHRWMPVNCMLFRVIFPLTIVALKHGRDRKN
jgi:hypothetical protein